MLQPHQIKKEPFDAPVSEYSENIPNTPSPLIKCTCKKRRLSVKAACNLLDTEVHRQILVNFGLTRKKVFTLSKKKDKLGDKFTSYILSEPAFSKLLEDSYVVFQEFSHKFGTWVDIDEDDFIQDGTVLKAVFFPSVIERDDANLGSIKRKISESTGHKSKHADFDCDVIDIDSSEDYNGIYSSIIPDNNSSKEAKLPKNNKQKREKNKVNEKEEHEKKKKERDRKKDGMKKTGKKTEKSNKKGKKKQKVEELMVEDEEHIITVKNKLESKSASENLTDNISSKSSNDEQRLPNQDETQQGMTAEMVSPSWKQTYSPRKYTPNRYQTNSQYYSVYYQNSQGGKFYQNGGTLDGRMKFDISPICHLQNLCAKRGWSPPEFTTSHQTTGWTSKCWVKGISYLSRHKIRPEAEITAAKKALYDLSFNNSHCQSRGPHHNQHWMS